MEDTPESHQTQPGEAIPRSAATRNGPDNLRDGSSKDGSAQAHDSGHMSKVGLPYTASPIKLRIRRAMTHQDCDAENQPPAAAAPEPESASGDADAEQAVLQNKAYIDYLEKSKPAKFNIGDMVWAKLTGHPWWPCMIWPDPEEHVHTRFTGKGGTRSYHCLFFGAEGERGWVPEPFMLSYGGRVAFEKYANDCISSATQKSQKKAVLQKFEIRPSRRPAWEVAALAADEAFKLDVEERKQRYALHFHGHGITEYEHGPQGMPNQHTHSRKRPHVAATSEAKPVKRKRDPSIADHAQPAGQSGLSSSSGLQPASIADAALSASELPSVTGSCGGAPVVAGSPAVANTVNGSPPAVAGPARVLPPLVASPDGGLPSVGSPGGEVPPYIFGNIPSPKKGKNPAVSFFNSFISKRTPAVSTEHPDWTQQIVRDFLKCEWSQMNERQKAKYRVRPGRAGATDAQPGLAAVVAHVAPSPLGTVNGLHGSVSFTVRLQTDSDSATAADRAKKKLASRLEAPSQRPRNRITITTSHLDALYSSSAGPAKTDSGRACLSVPLSDGSQDSVPEGGGKDGGQANGPTTGEPAAPGGQSAYRLEILNLSSAWSSKKELACLTCEKVGGDMLSCQQCYTSYHPSCIDAQAIEQKDFVCTHCATDSHVCFICKKPGGSNGLKKCEKAQCGKFYHHDCLTNHLLSRTDENDKLICPLHICASCAEGNNRCPKALSGRFFTCIRCPVAYHVGDYCVAAGSATIGGCNIICSNHFAPGKSRAHLTHVNVSWCFVCNRGGTLLCCDGCPAAFHADCLGIPFPEGLWFCNDCRVGKKPLYGNLVWVKLGIYRWWPGEICLPRNVPRNIQDMPHRIGEFPIRFFGSHDYFWTHHARVFVFHEGDKGSRDATPSKNLAKVFKLAISEATLAFQQYKAIKERKDQEELDRTNRKPPYWKYLKTNLPVGNVTFVRPDPDDLPHCECKPDGENPCGDDTCLNRMMMYECNPATCPAGQRCQNQRFQKRRYPLQEPFYTYTGRGWGLRTKENIRKGDFVNEYVGELIDEKECRRRMERAQQCNVTQFYMLTLDRNRIIDAGPKGNLARFMNHSCMPNLISQKWTVNGNIRCGLFALQDIPAGTELTFNYNLDCLGNEKMACNCKTPMCSGFIGDRPKQVASATKKVKPKAKSKSKRRRSRPSSSKDHDECCFRCGEGGHLLLCDMAKCTKAYHIECLNRQRRPYGKWYCPRHFCVACGLTATQQCSACPNSFCMKDAAEDKIKLVNGVPICFEHDPEAHSTDDEDASNDEEEQDAGKADSGTADKAVRGGVGAPRTRKAAVQTRRAGTPEDQQPQQLTRGRRAPSDASGFDLRKRTAPPRPRRAAAALVEGSGKGGADTLPAGDVGRIQVQLQVV